MDTGRDLWGVVAQDIPQIPLNIDWIDLVCEVVRPRSLTISYGTFGASKERTGYQQAI